MECYSKSWRMVLEGVSSMREYQKSEDKSQKYVYSHAPLSIRKFSRAVLWHVNKEKDQAFAEQSMICFGFFLFVCFFHPAYSLTHSTIHCCETEGEGDIGPDQICSPQGMPLNQGGWCLLAFSELFMDICTDIVLVRPERPEVLTRVFPRSSWAKAHKDCCLWWTWGPSLR